MSRNSTKNVMRSARLMMREERLERVALALSAFIRERGFSDVADLAIEIINGEENDEREVSDNSGELHFRSSRGEAAEGTEGD